MHSRTVRACGLEQWEENQLSLGNANCARYWD